MNKANAELLELALTGRGRELAICLAISRLCDDVDQVFRSIVNSEDRKQFKLLARLSSKLIAREFKVNSFSSSLRRGQWGKAVDAVEELAVESDMSTEEAFSALIGIVLVPACFVDQFTLAVLDHARICDVAASPRLINASVTFTPLCNSWVRRLTREALTSLVTCAVVLSSRDPTLLNVIEDEADGDRFKRLQKVFQLIADNSESYSEVISLVNLETWREADLVANNYLSRIGVQTGVTFDNPPALADFLIVAMTQAWSADAIARARTSRHWR